jgi:acetyltransferase-like isoleucine patch superfamily enzyme
MNFKDLQREFHHTPYIYGNNKLELAADVQLQNAVINLACGTVKIGYGTFCGHNVCILTGSHTLDHLRQRAPQGRDIVIGKFVWIASNATVLGPCEIGDRCVIAAGAVVTPRMKCEAGWMYAGVPARKIRPAIDYRADAGIGPPLLTDQRKRK